MTPSEPTVPIRLEISGMSCGSCVAHVEEALLGTDGVSRVQVDLESGSATVEGEAIDAEQLIDAVTRAGYEGESG